MAKYYIKTGTLEIIFSTEQEPYDACRTAIHECNSNDEVDELILKTIGDNGKLV